MRRAKGNWIGHLVTALMIGALGLAIGCGGKKAKVDESGLTQGVTKQTSMSGDPNEPEWVRKGGAGFDDAMDKFYGVGISQGITNRALQMQTADQRARTELSRVLNTYTANFMKDYMSSAIATDMDDSQEEQFVSSITKSITETTLVGSKIVDHFKGPDGTMYSLAEVSFDSLAGMMRDKMAERAQELKMTADEALRELDEQLEKRHME